MSAGDAAFAARLHGELLARAGNLFYSPAGVRVGTGELFIGSVLHEAVVDVDECGTEAAAGTAVVAVAGGVAMPETAAAFRADHPFLLLVRDTRSQAILFAGRLVDPGSP